MLSMKSRISIKFSSNIRSRLSLSRFHFRFLSTEKNEDDTDHTPSNFKDRWKLVIPAFATHMCIGSSYAWSLMADVISREIGFVAPAAADITLMQAAMPLSIVLATFGISASLLGDWQARVGPRKSLRYASVVYGGSLVLGATAIHLNSLPLLYIGYGFFGGLGVGMAYTPPVQTLLQWFPDKKGFASGLTIAGFGSSAILFTQTAQMLMKHFSRLPEYLGPTNSFSTRIVDGKLFADTVDRGMIEVVSAGPGELAKLPFDLAEGLYVVGTGATGASEALAILGGVYFTTMFLSSFAMKKPHPSFVPPGVSPSSTPRDSLEIKPLDTALDLTAAQAMTKPQFYLLGTTFLCVATGGMGLFSVAKPLMSEVFSNMLPTVVTSEFAMKYLLVLSACNLGGRIGWAIISDKIGRRNVFLAFTFSSIPLYLALPSLVDAVVATGSAVPMYAFIASTGILISMVGGVYAVLPAYEADLFGSKHIGAIHGKMLLASAMAAIVGPSLLLMLRSHSELTAIHNLIALMTPDEFQVAFGVSLDQAKDLISTKTLTISKLLPHLPLGTPDPTPHLYDSTMYTMTGLMGVAVLSHAFVKPIKTDIKDISTKNSTS